MEEESRYAGLLRIIRCQTAIIVLLVCGVVIAGVWFLSNT